MRENKNALTPVAEFITKYLSSFVEILAAFVIAIALMRFIFRYVANFTKPHIEQENQNVRIQFGSSLTLALELLLAADILATAIAPTGMKLASWLPSPPYEQP